MPWSIFQQGGGAGSATTWAQELQQRLGIAPNPTDTQFIYDWEVSEGGGGAYNPLNQGVDPPYSVTGPQYGGGAADYASWDAGLQGSVDYLHMTSYSGVLKGLQDQNYAEAEQALWNSPWAGSHYGYGSKWSTDTPPGATPLPATAFLTSTKVPGDSSSSSSQSQQSTSPLSGGSFWSLLGIPDPIDLLERFGLILLGGLLILLGIYLLAGKQTLQLTPLRKFTQQGQQRAARERREARQVGTGERQERALGLRERRVALAERTEARHRGE